MSLVRVENLSVQYGTRTVLSHVSLCVEKGEIVTIVGPNGSGKTSLLRAIIGAVEPLKGLVSKDVGVKIGYVPQKLHVDETLPMTVSRFLKLPGGVTAQGAIIAPFWWAIPTRIASPGIDRKARFIAFGRGNTRIGSARLRCILSADRTSQAGYRLRYFDDQPRITCRDERFRPCDLSQRPRLL